MAKPKRTNSEIGESGSLFLVPFLLLLCFRDKGRGGGQELGAGQEQKRDRSDFSLERQREETRG